ncbi:MAG TPA: SurA N-terminal domain-containing protein [Spirochaetota bacterium]|nr:SurA N-terminal domain-containing protein [Spirochaetota bacterium]OPZ38910.1 MAG: Peptidyl-prolyl cis-trans isomerase D [Spirochaetes bacterium ADurb.BinA120]HNU91302.1 SurA N-terminal domain-containing protein [Spirochaetota bacterium]HPI13447.1 SurA N-terminal domain-containing protein [Spirochaetota bacterium]HPO46879.1 SurA N-terminal domain-containing protein [Spirochaetota bacterium]
MFDSRSPVIKIAGYAIVGFFVLIIIISFGMPDFMSRLGMDKSTVAIINGEKIHHLDFLRYRNSVSQRVPDATSKEMQNYILDSMIRYRLQLQKARDIGIRVSDERVKRVIREMPMFRDDSGRFNRNHLNLFLDHHHLSLNDYYVMVREDLVNEELIRLIQSGAGVTREEILVNGAVENSRIQIRYCYAANSDLRKRWAGDIRVTDAEVDAELAANRSEVKDPKTDRQRIKSKLEDRKFEAKKKEIIGAIDRLSLDGGPFEQAVARLGGMVRTSAVFKAGEPVRETGAKGVVIYSLSDSPLFVGDCLSLRSGASSRVVSSFDGLYVFTPLVKDVPMREPAGAQYEATEMRLRNEKTNAVYINMMTAFLEKSKVSKNLNFD